MIILLIAAVCFTGTYIPVAIRLDRQDNDNATDN